MNEEILYFIVCFLQPIILPLPEPVTIIGGSSILGPLKGATIGFTGTVLGIIVMFLIAKFARRSIINKIIDDKKIDKFNKYIQKNETIIILMLFVLPILPDEVICIGAGLAKMNSYKFIGIATMSKLVTSISLAYSLELINFNPIYITISIVLIIGISIIKKIKLCIS